MSFQSYGHANNQLKEEFERAKNDWSSYLLSDQLSKTLFLVDDKEIIDLVKKTRDDYLDSLDTLTYYRQDSTAVEVGKAARAPEEIIRPEVIKIQALINDRLEQL
jgi:hypothetical protein